MVVERRDEVSNGSRQIPVCPRGAVQAHTTHEEHIPCDRQRRNRVHSGGGEGHCSATVRVVEGRALDAVVRRDPVRHIELRPDRVGPPSVRSTTPSSREILRHVVRIVARRVVVVQMHGCALAERDVSCLDDTVILRAIVVVPMEVRHCNDVAGEVHLRARQARATVGVRCSARPLLPMAHLFGEIMKVDAPGEAILVGALMRLVEIAHGHAWSILALDNDAVPVHKPNVCGHHTFGLCPAHVAVVGALVGELQRLSKLEHDHTPLHVEHVRQLPCLEASVDGDCVTDLVHATLNSQRCVARL
mmetsp:Transcript_99079/g.222004  ORF Transcript_99079/g.222004 Transcript_99079/m.222004 type:complete len:303 (-) Transcript_99079:216-1124(-)